MSSDISITDYTHLVLDNFPRHQWGIAYEGLVQGIAAWNEKYATSSVSSPEAFLATVCRRHVYAAMRTGDVLPEYRSHAVVMSRSSFRQRSRSKRLQRQLSFMDSRPRGDDDAQMLPAVMVEDDCFRKVINSGDDSATRFIESLDVVDQTIVRLRSENTQVSVVCNIAGISPDEYRRRVHAMRHAFNLWKSIESRRVETIAHEKRTAAVKQPPSASNTDDQTGVAEPQTKEPWL